MLWNKIKYTANIAKYLYKSKSNKSFFIVINPKCGLAFRKCIPITDIELLIKCKNIGTNIEPDLCRGR